MTVDRSTVAMLLIACGAFAVACCLLSVPLSPLAVLRGRRAELERYARERDLWKPIAVEIYPTDRERLKIREAVRRLQDLDLARASCDSGDESLGDLKNLLFPEELYGSFYTVGEFERWLRHNGAAPPLRAELLELGRIGFPRRDQLE